MSTFSTTSCQDKFSKRTFYHHQTNILPSIITCTHFFSFHGCPSGSLIYSSVLANFGTLYILWYLLFWITLFISRCICRYLLTHCQDNNGIGAQFSKEIRQLMQRGIGTQRRKDWPWRVGPAFTSSFIPVVFFIAVRASTDFQSHDSLW